MELEWKQNWIAFIYKNWKRVNVTDMSIAISILDTEASLLEHIIMGGNTFTVNEICNISV